MRYYRQLKYTNFYGGDFYYDIDWEDEKEVIKEILKEQSGKSEEKAEEIVQIFNDYDLIDKVIEDNMDFVLEYFEQEAYEQYKFGN